MARALHCVTLCTLIAFVLFLDTASNTYEWSSITHLERQFQLTPSAAKNWLLRWGGCEPSSNMRQTST